MSRPPPTLRQLVLVSLRAYSWCLVSDRRHSSSLLPTMPIVTARSEGEALPSGQLIKAIYDYTADVLESKVLSFSAGDHFVVIKSTKPEEWLYVVSAAGRLGYIPANFITIDVLPDKVFLNLLDQILSTLSSVSSSASNPPNGASADLLTVRQVNHARVKLSQVRSDLAQKINSQKVKQHKQPPAPAQLEKRASINTLDDVESAKSETVEVVESKTQLEAQSRNEESNELRQDSHEIKAQGEEKVCLSASEECQENEVQGLNEIQQNELIADSNSLSSAAVEEVVVAEDEKEEKEKEVATASESSKGGSKSAKEYEGRANSVKDSSKECMIEKDEKHDEESREGHGKAECREQQPGQFEEPLQGSAKDQVKPEQMPDPPPGLPVTGGDDDGRAEAAFGTLDQKIRNKDTAEYSSASKVEQAKDCTGDNWHINSSQNTLHNEDDLKGTHDEQATNNDPTQLQVDSTSDAIKEEANNSCKMQDESITTSLVKEEANQETPSSELANPRRLDLALEKKRVGGSNNDSLSKKSLEVEMDEIETSSFNELTSDDKVRLESLIHILIEKVRVSSDLSHNKCKKTVGVVIRTLADAYPEWSHECHLLLRQLRESSVVTPTSNHHWLKSSDMEKLKEIFANLWSASTDEQQRGWPIHEDEQVILGLLVELNKVLTDANPLMTREFVSSHDFNNVTMLCTYFQMETRRSIRLQLMRVLIQVIKLENRVISEVFLSHSVLPASLADELKCHLYDGERWVLAAKLLTLVFATGHKPPITVYEHINERFVTFLTAVIESDLEQLLLIGPPISGPAPGARPGSAGGRITPTASASAASSCEIPPTETSIPLILALNLHLESSFEYNFILTVLAKKQTCSQLTENLVSFLNWEEDPTFDTSILSDESFTHERKNAVHKLLIEILTYKQTASIFYLNDLRVLMDIVISHLNNLEPSVAKERIACLEIAQQVLINTSYLEDPPNKMTDLVSCLNGILAEESLCQQEKTLAFNVQQLIQSHTKVTPPPTK